VIAGLRAAGNFACAFGEDETGKRYYEIADKIKDALIANFYNKAEGRFARMGTRNPNGYELDMTVDASLYGLIAFETLGPEQPMAESTMEAVKKSLRVNTSVGGIARYSDDYYHRVNTAGREDIPGNPWFICTLWVTEYDIMRAENLDELNKALSGLEWVADRALQSGVLAEQINPFTGEPLSVSPLTWSHAAFVTVLLKYMEKKERLLTCESCGHSLYYMHRQAQKPCNA